MTRMVLKTDRLELAASTAELALAAARDHAEFGRLLSARVPAEWPPELMRDAMEWVVDLCERDPLIGGWGVWWVVLDEPASGTSRDEQRGREEWGGRTVIGSVGFKGRPRSIGGRGTSELGYSVLDDFQRRGYGSEATQAIVDWAFLHPQVERLTAHTFERHHASLGVLRRCGFAYAGPGTEKVDENERLGRGNLVLWELTREAWEAHRRASSPAGPQKQNALGPSAAIVGLHHLQITVPPDQVEAARRFYCGVLGLVQVPKPASLAARGGLWVRVGDRNLHIGVEDGVDRSRTKAHVAYHVRSLIEWRKKLAAAGIQVKESIPIPGHDRLEFRDPFGNRVELIEPIIIMKRPDTV